MSLRVFTSTDHPTRWPVGGASLVIAQNETEARKLLGMKLSEAGLEQNDRQYTLKEISTETPQAIVLCDGDY